MVRSLTAFCLAAALLSPALLAQQPPPPLPPEVGDAVLLATHSIQIDRDTVVTRGDLVVNDAGPAPWLGERELSLDQNVRTPRGFNVKANGVDIDAGAVVGGDVRCNVVQNNGTVEGQIRTPLPLPVIAQLPALIDRPSGTQSITVDNGQSLTLGTGDYAGLVVKRDATLHLPGGPYTFASITTERGATIVWDGPGEVVVNGAIAFAQSTTIAAAPGLSTKHKMFFAHAGLTIGKECNIAATVLAPNGTIDAGDSLVFTGALAGRDIHIGRGSTLTLRSGFRNLPPVADSQTITVSSSDPVVITLTGSDPDLDPLRFAPGLPPTNGTLGPIIPSGPTSAVVVYTPRVARPNDVFTFRVIDSENFSAEGIVTINEGLELPGPPTTIMAANDVVEVPPDRPSNIVLRAIGPQGVPITISIVPGSGPSFGTLGPVMQQQQNPFRPAQVPYIPNPGFIGEDAFQFEACGVINDVQVCATATIRIAVIGTEPAELAPDRTETATSGASLPIVLATPGPATYEVLSLPQNGTLTDSNGVPISSVPYRLPSAIVSYRSDAGFTGTVSFDYRVSTGGPQPQTDTGTITINVQPAPGSETGGDLAPDLTVTVASGSPITFSISSGGGATAYRVLSLPSPGTLRDSTGNVITAAPYTLPTPELTFQSAAGFTGTLSFTYSVNAGPQSDTGIVTIVVTAGDDNGR